MEVIHDADAAGEPEPESSELAAGGDSASAGTTLLRIHYYLDVRRPHHGSVIWTVFSWGCSRRRGVLLL